MEWAGYEMHGMRVGRLAHKRLWIVRESSAAYRAGAECRAAGPRGSSDRAALAYEAERSDRLEDLGDEIATLSAHIHAATHRLLELIAEFDALEGWKAAGHRSCAHWLAFRTGVDLRAAREKVRAARALRDLPETTAAMSRGELSFAKVRALTRVATAQNEAELLEFARGSTAAQLERLVRGWKLLSRKDEAELERLRHASRCLSVFPGDDGMYLVRGRLDPEVGALVMRAIEAAGEALFRREATVVQDVAAPSSPAALLGTCAPPPADVTPEQRRADALGLLAERALAAGFERDGAAGPLSGARAERYQVVLHLEPTTLDRHDEPGMSELEDGTRVSAETSRRLSCDASLVELTRTSDGRVLDVGRRTRTIPPAIRRALEARDRGCRFPGCRSRFTDAHHVVHWADGGATKLDNLLLLCHHHHRLLHEEGYRVELNPWPGGRPVFYDPRGLPVPETPPPSPKLGADPVQALVRGNRRRGADPDRRTTSSRWKREEDIPDRVLYGAWEALDPAEVPMAG